MGYDKQKLRIMLSRKWSACSLFVSAFSLCMRQGIPSWRRQNVLRTARYVSTFGLRDLYSSQSLIRRFKEAQAEKRGVIIIFITLTRGSIKRSWSTGLRHHGHQRLHPRPHSHDSFHLSPVANLGKANHDRFSAAVSSGLLRWVKILAVSSQIHEVH